MATPTHVQSTGWVEDVSDVVTLTLNSVVAGNTLVALVSQYSGTARTYTVVSSNGGDFTKRQDNNPGRVVQIWSLENVASGTHTITITSSAGATFEGLAVEIGSISTTPFDVANQNDNTAGTTSHFCAPAGEIDTAAAVYCICVGALSGTTSGFTKGADWTTLGAGPTDRTIAQYRISAGALTDERGPWSSAAGRASTCAIASFKGATASGWGPLLGGGRNRLVN